MTGEWNPLIEGDVLAPDAIWAWRYAERTFPADQLLGYSLEHDNGNAGPLAVPAACGADDCGSGLCGRSATRLGALTAPPRVGRRED